MKLGELHCTYSLLEEKTNYVSQLESSLSCTDTKRPSFSNLTTQTKGQSFVTDRSESDRLSTDTNTINLGETDQCKKRKRFLRATSEIKSFVSKLKPKNFSTTCNVDGDKLLQRDYIEDITLMRLTDMILNTLALKQKQYEFVKHASTLALFETQKCQNSDGKVRDCALYYNTSFHETQREVVIQFLKDIRFDIKNAAKRNTTVPNIRVSR